jgi:hypothetical protein
MSAGLDDVRRLRASFRTACERSPETRRCRGFAFARRRARFDVVGARLATSIERAFARLAVADEPEATPALRVEVWDESDTGVAPPVRVDGVRSAERGRIIVAGNEAWVGAYDRARRYLVAAVRSAARLPRMDHAPPFERLLLIWYGDQGCGLLHAGMVVSPTGKGILLPGAGQSGKSTTVFACANRGFEALGDDCIAVERESDGRFTGYGVFSSLFVERTTVRLFGGAGTPEPGDPRGREIVSLATGRAAALRAGATVQAIVLQRVTPGGRSMLTRIGRAEALRTLLPAAMVVDPRGVITRGGFEALTALLERVPCYRLAAGSDLHAIPAAVAGAVEETDS